MTSECSSTINGVLKYDSNNSGGGWWLKEKDWQALEGAGWTVHWIAKGKYGWGQPSSSYKDPLKPCEKPPAGKTYLGARACSAAKEFSNPHDGIAEWERITGENAKALGCYSCCGPPHSFTWERGDEHEYFSPSAPEFGEYE